MRNSKTPIRNCSICSRPDKLRRDRCYKCYQRWLRRGDLATSCQACGHDDVTVLVRRVLVGIEHTLCGNCSAAVGKRRMTLEAFQRERVSLGLIIGEYARALDQAGE